MNLQTANLLEQAQLAHAASNWALLLQCLQQLMAEVGSRKSEFGSEFSPSASSASSALFSPTPDSSVRAHSSAPLPSPLTWAIDILTWGDFHQRWDVAKLLPKFGREAIASLLEILADEDADEELRWFAIRSLGTFDDPEAIAALVELLQTSSNLEEQGIAAAALAEIGSNAVSAITKLLERENTRALAVRSLAYIRTKETIEPLLSVVRDSDVEIRAIAIEALSSFHDPKIPPILIDTLSDLGAKVRKEAVTGLSFRPDLREELNLVDLLLLRLYDFSIDVCLAAANGLGRLGTDRAATGLFRVLQSPHTPSALQIEIVLALGRIETSASLEYLRQVFEEITSIAIWQETINALGRVEQLSLKPQAAEILLELLRTNRLAAQHAKLKQAIALSLGQLGEMQAIPSLIQLLADSELAVKLHAIAALKQLNSTAAHQQLTQIAADANISLQLQQGVAIALREWDLNSSF
ncbi:HEAT repeat domain-containing protein [Chroococcidiopsis sp. FACHB-1243]|uniref:HEAT repeat domain-containing protein n=1 Tax=Chroococcidiopsis sp. [FACHB-1243] TaxID=2692781 RepID=UPI001786611A|nr:HEAT repeat domain-containing protein [Chroococcidiopsis sp. [FACHB-1243]]